MENPFRHFGYFVYVSTQLVIHSSTCVWPVSITLIASNQTDYKNDNKINKNKEFWYCDQCFEVEKSHAIIVLHDWQIVIRPVPNSYVLLAKISLKFD